MSSYDTESILPVPGFLLLFIFSLERNIVMWLLHLHIRTLALINTDKRTMAWAWYLTLRIPFKFRVNMLLCVGLKQYFNIMWMQVLLHAYYLMMFHVITIKRESFFEIMTQNQIYISLLIILYHFWTIISNFCQLVMHSDTNNLHYYDK